MDRDDILAIERAIAGAKPRTDIRVDFVRDEVALLLFMPTAPLVGDNVDITQPEYMMGPHVAIRGTVRSRTWVTDRDGAVLLRVEVS